MFVVFYFSVILNLSWDVSNLTLMTLFEAIARICMVLVLLNATLVDEDTREKILNIFLVCIMFAAFSIFLQYLVGPLDWLLSERHSYRAGHVRLSSFAGNTIILGAAIPYALIFLEIKLLRFYYDDKQYFLVRTSQLLLVLCAFLILSRTAVGLTVFSIILIFLRPIIEAFHPAKSFRSLLLVNVRIKYRSFLIACILTFSVFLFGMIYSDQLSIALAFFNIIPIDEVRESGIPLVTNNIFTDLLMRLTWFKPDIMSNFYSYLFGAGTVHYGGTLGISNYSFAHNTYIDIYQAQGFVGVFLFFTLLVLLIYQSIKLGSQNFWAVSSVVLVFLLSATHNSGLLFHPLWIFPLIYFLCYQESKTKTES